MRLLRLSSILVATDLGETSMPALRTAGHLARLADGRIHLLHARDTAIGEGTVRLREQLRVADPSAPDAASVYVSKGDPARAILARAAEVDADVIILGPHRRGVDAGEEVGELGSTASSVVGRAACPCLVAATDLRLPLNRIVAPIDLSEIADGALAVAVSWASALRPRGATVGLAVLHVAQDTDMSAAGNSVRAAIEKARSLAGGAGHVGFREVVHQDADVVTAILRAADADAADLIVMGTRGEAGVAAGLGSVSAAVAKQTTLPLLLVPPARWAAGGAGISVLP